MQVTYAVLAVAASVLGIGFANVWRLAKTRTARVGLREVGMGALPPSIALLALLLFLFTLPARPPFASGINLGWGFLMGVVLGLYALYEAQGSIIRGGAFARGVGLLSAASLGPAAIILVFRGYPNAALMGYTLGAAFVALLCSGVLRPAFAASGGDDREALTAYRGVELFALATIAITMAAWLGVRHFPRLPGEVGAGLWSFPALLVAAGGLGLILFHTGKEGKSGRWPLIGASIAAGAVGVVLAAVLPKDMLNPHIWPLILGGLAVMAFGLAALLQNEHADGDSSEWRPTSLALGAILAVLAIIAVAFRILQGYGEAIVFLAALPVLAVAVMSRERSREAVTENLITGMFSFALLLALYRVFIEQVSRGRPLDFQQHYDYIAVILGACACFATLAVMKHSAERLARARASGKAPLAPLWANALVIGFAVSAVPVALAALLGSMALSAFIVGLVVAEACWMMMAAWVSGGQRDETLAAAPHPYLIAAALVAVQFAPLVLEITISRTHKLIIVGVITVIALLWIGGTSWWHHLSQGEADDDEPEVA